MTKATGKGRRDIDDDLEPHDVQTFRQAAGTGLYLSIDRPPLQFAMSVEMSGGSSIAGSARGTVCSATPGTDLAVQLPSRPEDTVCVHGHGLCSGRAGSLYRVLWRGAAVTCLTVAPRSNHWLHCPPKRQSSTAWKDAATSPNLDPLGSLLFAFGLQGAIHFRGPRQVSQGPTSNIDDS